MKQTRHGEIKIRISGLSNGLHEYRFTAVSSEIGLEERFSQPVEIIASVDKTARQILLRASITTSGSFCCDRCLEAFEQPIHCTYSMFYVYDDVEGQRIPADDVVVIPPDTVHIDLRDDVRQTVILSVPLKLLCREDCRGLCPRCGMNLNTTACACKEEATDSRWQGLKDLLSN